MLDRLQKLGHGCLALSLEDAIERARGVLE
jgi:hypothetical protein